MSIMSFATISIICTMILVSRNSTGYALANFHCVPKWCERPFDYESTTELNRSITAASQQECADRLLQENPSTAAFAWRSVGKSCTPVKRQCKESDLRSATGEDFRNSRADAYYCYKACERIILDGTAIAYRSSKAGFPLPGSSTRVVCEDGSQLVGPSEKLCGSDGNLKLDFLGDCGRFVHVGKVQCIHDDPQGNTVSGCIPMFPIEASKCQSAAITLEKPGMISSPNWPGYYADNCNTTYTIIAPPGATIELTVAAFSGDACHDNLTIWREPTRPSFSICDHYDYLPLSIQSRHNVMRLDFKSDFSVTNIGFKAFFSFVYTCQIFEISNGIVTIVNRRESQLWLPHIAPIARIQCLPNFTLHGDSALACIENGKWFGSMPECLPAEKAHTVPQSGNSESLAEACISPPLTATAILISLATAFFLGIAATKAVDRIRRRVGRKPTSPMPDCVSLTVSSSDRRGTTYAMSAKNSNDSFEDGYYEIPSK